MSTENKTEKRRKQEASQQDYKMIDDSDAVQTGFDKEEDMLT